MAKKTGHPLLWDDGRIIGIGLSQRVQGRPMCLSVNTGKNTTSLSLQDSCFYRQFEKAIEVIEKAKGLKLSTTEKQRAAEAFIDRYSLTLAPAVIYNVTATIYDK